MHYFIQSNRSWNDKNSQNTNKPYKILLIFNLLVYSNHKCEKAFPQHRIIFCFALISENHKRKQLKKLKSNYYDGTWSENLWRSAQIDYYTIVANRSIDSIKWKVKKPGNKLYCLGSICKYHAQQERAYHTKAECPHLANRKMRAKNVMKTSQFPCRDAMIPKHTCEAFRYRFQCRYQFGAAVCV